MPITITLKIEQQELGMAVPCEFVSQNATILEKHLAEYIRDSLNELIKFYPTLTHGLYKKVFVVNKDPSPTPSDKATDASFGSGCDTAPCILPPLETPRDDEVGE